ncbi:MAG: type II toxin-antitoxin system HicA family toxin [Clostridiales bacterium]|jgi:predicted RNA binding protein YcfA (HicA-like mRNA interferase family)|nr:type II toxin-antitoxin system HicA family toxin [Clostridiales bacterium]
MSRLPVLSGEELIEILQRAGFRVVRQRGSHAFLKHDNRRVTVVPVHKGQDLDRGLLRKILRDINLSTDEFFALLKKR